MGHNKNKQDQSQKHQSQQNQLQQKKSANQESDLSSPLPTSQTISAQLSLTEQVHLAAQSPINQCLVSQQLFQAGLGNVLISRTLPDNSLAVSIFLLDPFCLGIKDVLFEVMTPEYYQQFLNVLKEREAFDNVDAHYLYKLVLDTESFAANIGFSAPDDYALAKAIFADIDYTICKATFNFGKNGKPFYIAGPEDSPEKSLNIVNTLLLHCGEGNFQYMAITGTANNSIDENIDEDDSYYHGFDNEGYDHQSEPPTYDFLKGKKLKNIYDLQMATKNLISAFNHDYFLNWDAIVRHEQNLPLTEHQQAIINDIFSNNRDNDVRISYIDNIPRPKKPWYKIINKVAPYLIIKLAKSYETYHPIYFSRWAEIAECLIKNNGELTLPAGLEMDSNIEVVPPEIRHQLYLQYCYEPLMGLGQKGVKPLTMADDQARVDDLIARFKQHRSSIKFLELSLEKFLSLIILPDKDQEIFIKLFMDKLQLPSMQSEIEPYL